MELIVKSASATLSAISLREESSVYGIFVWDLVLSSIQCGAIFQYKCRMEPHALRTPVLSGPYLTSWQDNQSRILSLWMRTLQVISRRMCSLESDYEWLETNWDHAGGSDCRRAKNHVVGITPRHCHQRWHPWCDGRTMYQKNASLLEIARRRIYSRTVCNKYKVWTDFVITPVASSPIMLSYQFF